MERWMKPDEYLEELRKHLDNPTSYKVSGFYNFHEKENNFIGLFEIDTNRRIVGEIQDSNSVCPKHLVIGEIKYLDDIALMNFVKIPTGLLANIYYHLKKPKEEIEGKYQGHWEFHERPFKLNLSGEELLKIATEKLTEEFSGYETEITNKTEITLSKT